ncbi:MAG: hypothetical protein VKL39_12540 [Leptolyngbyaceae bacterium]|nr:hypothetical protein [Leptolyngbyaceae bacterium]
MMTAILATAALASFANPAFSLEGRHAEEFRSSLGKKLAERTQQEFYAGLGNQ